MKLKKRKIKYSAIFFVCWFALLVLLVDGVLKFQTLVDYFKNETLQDVCATSVEKQSNGFAQMLYENLKRNYDIPEGKLENK